MNQVSITSNIYALVIACSCSLCQQKFNFPKENVFKCMLSNERTIDTFQMSNLI